MTPGKHVEYRVREIKRYTVTRQETFVGRDESESSGSNVQFGSVYDNFDTAYAVAYALCAKEHADLGYDHFDERIVYPNPNPPGTVMSLDPAFHSEDERREIGSVIVTEEGAVEKVEG